MIVQKNKKHCNAQVFQKRSKNNCKTQCLHIKKTKNIGTNKKSKQTNNKDLREIQGCWSWWALTCPLELWFFCLFSFFCFFLCFFLCFLLFIQNSYVLQWLVGFFMKLLCFTMFFWFFYEIVVFHNAFLVFPAHWLASQPASKPASQPASQPINAPSGQAGWLAGHRPNKLQEHFH